MKRFFALILTVSMLLAICPLGAFATTYSGTCGKKVTWSLDTSTGVLTISGEGGMKNFDGFYGGDYYAPWYDSRDTILYVVIEDGVTSIGDCAFEGFSKLSSITIPGSVTSIGYTVFYNCTRLTSIEIPDSVTSIGWGAFCNCTSLTSIDIPDSATSIGGTAFSGCKSLTSVTIGDSVTWIGQDAFYKCTSLTSVTISDRVTEIAPGAFDNCYNLKTVIYSGSEEDWNRIRIYDSNDYLVNAYKNSKCKHVWINDFPIEGTCKIRKECEKCGAFKKFVDDLAHIAGAEADCENDQICTVCGDILVEALGHNYKTVLTAPTCTQSGYKTYTCENCGDSYTDEIDALGHNYVSIATEPTCAEDGYTTHTCSRCGDSYITSTISNYPISVGASYTVANTRNDIYADNGIKLTDGRKGDVDGGDSDAYAGFQSIAEVIIDLGSVKTSNTYKVYLAAGAWGISVYENNWQVDVYYSNSENDTYTFVGSTTDAIIITGDGENDENWSTYTMTVESDKDISARYIKIKVTNTWGGHLWMDEVEIRGECDAFALGHDYDSVLTTPTCTGAGYTTHTCIRCGEYFTDSYKSALGHTPGLEADCENDQICTVCNEVLASALGHKPGSEADCENDQVCTVCGKVLVYALGHDYNAVATAPTCTEDGHTTYTCTRCDNWYVGDYTSALGHTGLTWKDNQTVDEWGDYVFDNAYSFVFELNGVDGCIYYGEENYIITNGDAYNSCNPNWAISVPLKATGIEGVYEVIDVIVHPGSSYGANINWNETDLVLVVHSAYSNPRGSNYQAKCAAEALNVGDLVSYVEGVSVTVNDHYVSNDNYDETVCKQAKHCYRCGVELVPAVPHNYDSVVTEPTCIEDGYTTYTCSRCDDSYVDDYTSSLGHNYDSVVTEPTCTEGGYTTYTCSRCGDSYVSDVVDALGHSNITRVIKPTCTEEGFTLYACRVCGISTIGNVVPALGHTEGEWVTLEDGSKELRCTVCGELLDSEAAPEYKTGDITGDGKVNMFDYMKVKAYYFGTTTLTDEQIARADLTGDGKVNMFDYMKLKAAVFAQ